VYLESVRQLERFLETSSLPTAPAALRREHIEAWIEELLARNKPATASVRFRSVQQFFKFLVEEGEIDSSPMRAMRTPIVPEQPVAVVSTDELERLIRSVSGRAFAERRDLAIIRLFVDTGMRLSELAGLRVEDLDFDQDVAGVMGKGRRMRACPFGQKTGLALQRYLRERARRRFGDSQVSHEMPNLAPNMSPCPRAPCPDPLLNDTLGQDGGLSWRR
jgi:site-specific recombinase XerD